MLMFIDLPDRWGRPVTAQVTIRLDTVEVRCCDTLVGIADREFLRAWLRRPDGVFAYDDMAWLATGNGVALAIDDVVPAWVLTDSVLEGLREQV
jgi:hypothetical protein